MKVLKINASANPNGISRVLVDYLIEALDATDVIDRDVALSPLPTMEADTLMSFYSYQQGAEVSAGVAQHLALSEVLIEELKAADAVVLGVPMYNFGIPAYLKQWFDHVARQGLTFRYGENGPEGLIGETSVFVVATSGGTPIGSPADHASTHVRQVMGFLGASSVHVIDASGSKGSPEIIFESAQQQIDHLINGDHAKVASE